MTDHPSPVGLDGLSDHDLVTQFGLETIELTMDRFPEAEMEATAVRMEALRDEVLRRLQPVPAVTVGPCSEPGAWRLVPVKSTPEIVEAMRLCTIRNSRAADPAKPFESPWECAVALFPASPPPPAVTVGQSPEGGDRAFRKKPAVIEAMRWTGDNTREVAEWAHPGVEPFGLPPGWWMRQVEIGDHRLVIPTLEGEISASPGDWIIRGVKGEFYPCKPDVFAISYDAISHPHEGQGDAAEGGE